MKRKEDIYDDFKLKITLWSLGLYTNIPALQGSNQQPPSVLQPAVTTQV